jgi:hypothetical protein
MSLHIDAKHFSNCKGKLAVCPLLLHMMEAISDTSVSNETVGYPAYPTPAIGYLLIG